MFPVLHLARSLLSRRSVGTETINGYNRYMERSKIFSRHLISLYAPVVQGTFAKRVSVNIAHAPVRFSYLPSQHSDCSQSNAATAISPLPFPAMLSSWQVLCCLHKAMRGLEVTRLEQESSCQWNSISLRDGRPHFIYATCRVDRDVKLVTKITVILIRQVNEI